MKFAAQKLGSHLERTLAPVYLVAGDEPLVVAEALEAIRARAREAGFEQRDLVVVERGFRWDELEGDADNLSLFATRRILELRLPAPRPGDMGGKAIRALVERPDPDRLLLIATTRLDGSASRSVWVKTIDEAGVIVQAWPVDRAELPAWIVQRAGRARLTFSTGAAELLADRVEGNLLAADQEIQKLSLLIGEGSVDEETVLGAVASNTRFDVFKLVDTIREGSLRRSLSILAGLRAEGTEPALVSWALSRDLGLLLRLQTAVSQGASESQTLSRLRVWPRQQSLVIRASRRYRFGQLTKLLERAAEVDRVIKGLRRGRPWDELTQLVMAMLDSERRRRVRAA